MPEQMACAQRINQALPEGERLSWGMVAVVDSSVMLTGTETAHWLYNIAPVQCYRGTHYNTTPFPQFNDAPRTQDYNLLKTVANFSLTTGIPMVVAGAIGFFVGGPGGAAVGLKGALAASGTTFLVIAPATAAVAVGDIISGEASSLGTYILAAAEAATIYALTLGIETGIMKLMLLRNNPAMFYAGSILGAGASGFAVDAFTQFMTQNGEVDWERALKVGMFSAAVKATMLVIEYGVQGKQKQAVFATPDTESDAFIPPKIDKNADGAFTNGSYTLDKAGMDRHKYTSITDKSLGQKPKSMFLSDIDADKAVLDAAAYADEFNLWGGSDHGNKAKVYVENGPVGVVGDSGELTSWINVYRTKDGVIHGCPGNP